MQKLINSAKRAAAWRIETAVEEAWIRLQPLFCFIGQSNLGAPESCVQGTPK
jgi:hypothetical protein